MAAPGIGRHQPWTARNAALFRAAVSRPEVVVSPGGLATGGRGGARRGCGQSSSGLKARNTQGTAIRRALGPGAPSALQGWQHVPAVVARRPRRVVIPWRARNEGTCASPGRIGRSSSAHEGSQRVLGGRDVAGLHVVISPGGIATGAARSGRTRTPRRRHQPRSVRNSGPEPTSPTGAASSSALGRTTGTWRPRVYSCPWWSAKPGSCVEPEPKRWPSVAEGWRWSVQRVPGP